MPSMMSQCKLRHGTSERTCWLPVEERKSKEFKVGDSITLSNSDAPETLWTVLTIGEPRSREELHTDWNVGGIVSRH